MTAISFFSYKGGVGRTLTLANMAMQLVSFGKSVFVLDFDLEAPGLPYKLPLYIRPEGLSSGVVDYIYEFSSKGQVDDIRKYVINPPKNNPDDAAMWFLPAGDTNANEYWNKLSRIDWQNMFYSERGKGLRFFLDLKHKIKELYNPDFLLIDSRTGITELSGISLKLLADEVIMLLVNNAENISGTRKVLSFLYDKPTQDSQAVKTHLILTRVTDYRATDKEAFNREYKLLEKLKIDFAEASDGTMHDISVIHADERLAMDEQLALSAGGDENNSGINMEYLQLFEKIFRNKFDDEEWASRQNKTRAVQLFNKALATDDIPARISLLDEAIKLDGTNWSYFFYRGNLYAHFGDREKAIPDLEKALNLNKTQPGIYNLLANSYLTMGEYEKAIQLIDKSLSLAPGLDTIDSKILILHVWGKQEEALQLVDEWLLKYLNSARLLNTKANVLRKLGRYEEALSCVGKAISIDPKPTFYGTLAEIYGDQNRVDEFYLHLATALSKGVTAMDMRFARDAYLKFCNEPRFIELLRSYNINPEDIFHDGPLSGQLPASGGDLAR